MTTLPPGAHGGATRDPTATGPATPVPGNGGLADALAALSSPVRLAILKQLCTPLALHEIRVTAADADPGNVDEETAARPIARQVVKRHLDRLMDVGVVVTRDVRREYGHTVEYVVNHQTLFALSEAFRGLARLRPSLTPEAVTLPARGSRGSPMPGEDGPCLVLVKGLEEGAAFPLDGADASRSEWVIGRRRGLDVCLDFDPFVSSENAVVTATADGHVLQDLAESRNGTLVNFRPLPKGARHVLKTGDVIGVGRTLLLYRR